MQQICTSTPPSLPTGLDRDLLRQNGFLRIKSASKPHIYDLCLGRGQEKRDLAMLEPLFFPHLLDALEIVVQPEVFQSHFVVKVEIEVLQHLPARDYVRKPRFAYDAW